MKAYTIQLCQSRSKEREPGTGRPSLASSWESMPETRNLLKKLLESFGGQPAQNLGVRATIFGGILWAEASMHGQVQIHKLDHQIYIPKPNRSCWSQSPLLQQILNQTKRAGYSRPHFSDL